MQLPESMPIAASPSSRSFDVKTGISRGGILNLNNIPDMNADANHKSLQIHTERQVSSGFKPMRLSSVQIGDANFNVLGHQYLI
jgi:hypothetical protein